MCASYSYVNRDCFVLREDIVIMCDQVTIEEIDYNQNIMGTLILPAQLEIV